MTKKILCIHHSPCLDGFASAWVVGHHYGFDNVEFVGVKYGDPVPDMTDREVFIVDFSYPPAILIPAAAKARSVVVLDHHKGAKIDWTPVPLNEATLAAMMEQYPDCDGKFYRGEAVPMPDACEAVGIALIPKPKNLEVIISDDYAGTVTTWNYFYPRGAVPPVLDAIDHGDRWVFNKLTRVREVCEYCRSQGFLTGSADKFEHFGKTVLGEGAPVDLWKNYGDIANKGKDVIKVYDSLVDEMIPWDNPNLIEFPFLPHELRSTIPCHAVPDFFKSGVGDRFGKFYPFSITYDDNLVPGHRKFSLRSDKETGMDVERIARMFGGSGHKNAAGFIIPFNTKTSDSSVRSMLTNRWVELHVPKQNQSE
jgi:hypothetical protein